MQIDEKNVRIPYRCGSLYGVRQLVVRATPLWEQRQRRFPHAPSPIYSNDTATRVPYQKPGNFGGRPAQLRCRRSSLRYYVKTCNHACRCAPFKTAPPTQRQCNTNAPHESRAAHPRCNGVWHDLETCPVRYRQWSTGCCDLLRYCVISCIRRSGRISEKAP